MTSDCKTTKRLQTVGIFEQLWQTHAEFKKRAPGHNQFRTASKLVFDDCIR